MAFAFGNSPAPATGFSFGTPAPAPASGFSFGGAPAPAVPSQASAFGGFGAAGAPAPAPTTSAFGGGTSAFGAGTSTFGGSAPGFGVGTSAFGAATPGGSFGSTATLQQQQLQNQQQATLAAVAAFTEIRQRVRAAATWVAVLELLDLEGDERTDDEDSGPTARLQAVSAGEYASKPGVSPSHLQRSEAVSPTLPCSSRVFLTLGRRVIGEGWFPNAEVDVVGRPRIPVTLSKLGAAAPATENVGAASTRELEKLFFSYAEKAAGSNAPNPDCRMKHVVYNQVDPNLRYSYTRPAHIDEKAWKKAEEDNPDPSKLAPAAVIGWESLKERLVVQQGEVVAMAKNVQYMRSTAGNGLRSVALLRTRMEASRRTHLAQAHRFLKIQSKLESIRFMNKPLIGEDRLLRMKLEKVQRSLDPPQQMLKDLNAALLQGERMAEEVEEITDPEQLANIFEALDGQRDGLEHLMRILKKDRQDLEIMKKQLPALTQ